MKKIIIGNFKMNTKPSEFKSYAMALATKTKGAKNDIVVCPPYTHLGVAREFFGGSEIEYVLKIFPKKKKVHSLVKSVQI